jgi:hypothetical protein
MDCSAFFTSRPRSPQRVQPVPSTSASAGRRQPERVRRATGGSSALKLGGAPLSRAEGLQAVIREHVPCRAVEEWVREEPGWEVCAPQPRSVLPARSAGRENEALLDASTRQVRCSSHAARRQVRPAPYDRQRGTNEDDVRVAWDVIRRVAGQPYQPPPGAPQCRDVTLSGNVTEERLVVPRACRGLIGSFLVRTRVPTSERLRTGPVTPRQPAPIGHGAKPGRSVERDEGGSTRVSPLPSVGSRDRAPARAIGTVDASGARPGHDWDRVRDGDRERLASSPPSPGGTPTFCSGAARRSAARARPDAAGASPAARGRLASRSCGSNSTPRTRRTPSRTGWSPWPRGRRRSSG